MVMHDEDLAIRHYIYDHFVQYATAPAVAVVAQEFGTNQEQMAAIFRRLHDRLFFFLKPGTTDILMANPFSAVPTSFQVQVRDKNYWANCAWDMLGIPAALDEDATINARYMGDGAAVNIQVKNGSVQNPGGIVHFALPFQRWYDDLVLT